MKWLDRSEVELIRILWPSEIEALDETLSDLLRLMNTPSEIRKNQQFHPIGWSKGRAPLRQVGFDLALSLSPTIKLSRLFFVKLASALRLNHTKSILPSFISLLPNYNS
ncbi:hypothetical protein MJO28_011940 [Puccinia striiformis f. sp. tritici]|uniref:Uncharacterized protein n=1 Tax=Puccinia striiformis f. sp. tritici TaxID=168172 RepID=A0ACC0E1H3_9BASI|nr:hypothetical protein MJO28_011940 [Puccinia striiformis f. sp. tritici]KAI9631067.1 hypothetical protein KEM48_013324 [Puccinia striiformis f. sp. tritici PST-130]